MKKMLCILSLVSVVIISFAFMKDDNPKYENLKVLSKNITKQEMDSVMKHFSQSLGVKCTFCHVRNNDEKKDFNFASDENNKKLIARDMMRMTNKINSKYFKEDNDENHGNMLAAVTCFTCHNGKEEPGNKPPPPPPRK